MLFLVSKLYKHVQQLPDAFKVKLSVFLDSGIYDMLLRFCFHVLRLDFWEGYGCVSAFKRLEEP